MTLFDDREKAFEAKFSLDQETAFKITVRRDKLLGLWAAGKMGLSGDDATAYARTLIDVELAPGDHDIGRKVLKDLQTCGVAVDETEIRAQMAAIQDTAREQIIAERGCH